MEVYMPKKKKRTHRQLQTRIHNGMLLDGIPATVGRDAWVVYDILSLFHNWTTGLSFPTHKRIMELAGISHRKVLLKYIKRLEQTGLITVEFRKNRDKNGNPVGRKRYFYWLTYPANSTYIRGSLPIKK